MAIFEALFAIFGVPPFLAPFGQKWRFWGVLGPPPGTPIFGVFGTSSAIAYPTPPIITAEKKIQAVLFYFSFLIVCASALVFCF